MLRIGTAGWKYKDWEGVVYPKPRPRHFDDLQYISRYFSVVEINSSFYGPPRPNAAKAWTESVQRNKAFRFTLKLYQSFTHSREPASNDESDFKNGIAPIVEAGRLGAVLLQFPWSFRNDGENRAYLISLQRRFREYPLVLEIRHSTWIQNDVLDMLAELGIGICNIDQPIFHRSVKPSATATSKLGYVRLHGRNYQMWFSSKADVRERYDYLYSKQELDPWIDRIRKVEQDADDTYVVTNNHNLGKAAVNALEISALLSNEEVSVPQTLLGRYPDLAGVARNTDLL